jgi:hypothetical protein
MKCEMGKFTVTVTSGKSIKCGDQLHCYPSNLTGKMMVILADRDHPVNAVAGEDLLSVDGDVVLDSFTGKVYCG